MARPGARIQPVTLYSDKEEVESAFKTATKPWICYNCRKTYSLLESMGSLECCQHPGTIQENGVWSCCGNKIYPVRWATNIDVQRLYTGPGCQQSPPKVRGCQPCDHNTSNKMWNHTDSTEIAALSALLPFMNKEFPFVLRKGFDQGVLRRCMKRELHLPPEIGAEVYYLKNDGQTAIHTVQWYRVNTTIVYTDENNVKQTIEQRFVELAQHEPAEGYGSMQTNGMVTLQPVPQGMEIKATRPDKSIITNWW